MICIYSDVDRSSNVCKAYIHREIGSTLDKEKIPEEHNQRSNLQVLDLGQRLLLWSCRGRATLNGFASQGVAALAR
jgi:hypothetical protein